MATKKQPKVDKSRRVIWSDDQYDEWKESMMKYEGAKEEDCTYARYYEDVSLFLQDERENLDVALEDGVYIVAFAVLGLWDGKHTASKVIGSGKVNKIFNAPTYDYTTFFCDRYDVRCETTHHDGTNTMLFRLCKGYTNAKKLVDAIAYHGLTEQGFRRRTKSMRRYIAKVYGW
jgi:hypothetical protein